MQAIIKNAKTPKFVPDFIATSLKDIEFEHLKKLGVKYVAFDADSTLVHIRGTVLPDETKKLLNQKRKLFKAWCIASNRPMNDLHELAKSIDASVIRASLFVRKPRRSYFNKVLAVLNAEASEVAMIGDKLIADMMGAKKMGMVTVWVEKIGPDNPWDWLLRLRFWEKRLMRKYLSVKNIS